MKSSFKKDKSKIRAFNCYSVYRYAKANNKYMKYYDKDKESSYFQYWGVNNLYGWATSQKLPVNNFEWIKVTSQSYDDLKKNYNEESDKGYFLEHDVQHDLHIDLPFLPERSKMGKVEKLVTDLHDKTEYVIHIRKKQALNQGLVLKEVHRAIKFNQNAWLKPNEYRFEHRYDMNTDLRKKTKKKLKKISLSW